MPAQTTLCFPDFGDRVRQTPRLEAGAQCQVQRTIPSPQHLSHKGILTISMFHLKRILQNYDCLPASSTTFFQRH